MPTNLVTKVTPAPDVLFQEVGEETVLLNLEDERYFVLNEVGARMWQCFADGDAPEQAAQRITGEFDADLPTIRSDMAELIQSLKTAGLVSTE